MAIAGGDPWCRAREEKRPVSINKAPHHILSTSRGQTLPQLGLHMGVKVLLPLP